MGRTAIGAVIAVLLLSTVMVPVLDGLTQETMHGNDLNEGESYYYCPEEVYASDKETCDASYTWGPSNGLQRIEWSIDGKIVRADYTVPDAGLVVYYGEKGFIASRMKPYYTNGEFTPEFNSKLSYYSYETNRLTDIGTLRMILDNGEFKIGNTGNSLGSWCYALCPKDVAEFVGGTKMILQDGKTGTCFQFAAVEGINGSTSSYPVMANYEVSDLEPGTYNALDDVEGTKILSYGSMQNGVLRYNEVQNGNASFTISPASHSKIIELKGFTGDYYRNDYGTLTNNATLYGGYHLAIVPYEQTWTSEYRDLIMLTPLLAAVGLLIGLSASVLRTKD